VGGSRSTILLKVTKWLNVFRVENLVIHKVTIVTVVGKPSVCLAHGIMVTWSVVNIAVAQQSVQLTAPSVLKVARQVKHNR